MYRSIAARKRKRRKELRNLVITFVGYIVFSVTGIALGFYLVYKLMPDHRWFQ